jgi:DNA invertase Pin-like site-specific DNA recombinase
MDFVGYARVSTAEQGVSGLGLEAQQAAIARFLRDGDDLIASFVEVETGKRCDRPELRRALDWCERHRATLLIAKLDRLARNVHFVSGLMESGVRFVAADMPTADPFRLHIEAAVAEDEARKISQRTKAALAAAKARGVKLGGLRPGAPDIRVHQAAGTAASAARAAKFASLMQPLILEIREGLRAEGRASGLQAITDELNRRKIASARGGRWGMQAVQNMLRTRCPVASRGKEPPA